MKCAFVSMGAENISTQALSAYLKLHGHETSLAFDQALFDDRNYLCMPSVARFLDHRETVLRQVERARPDLVAFSVMTPTYRWALSMAGEIKRRLELPVIFGGIHPTALPEQVLANDSVDMVCVGEGEGALLDLCDSMEAGRVDTSIPNLWLKSNGQVIRNPQRPLIDDLDTLPMPDKELFAPHVNIANGYLAVTARGCPFTCSYCECSYQAEEIKRLGGRKLRERSVELVVEELVRMHERYGFSWVDFRNNTFTATRKWVREFSRLYKRELNLPYRVFGHPSTIDDEIASLLKESGCYTVQLGIESIDPWVRREILNRRETNAQILKAVGAMDRIGLNYTCDYILGLPGQTVDELDRAVEFFSGRKACTRVSAFMLAYQPKLKINEKGIAFGDVTQAEIEEMESGKHSHYVADGSISKDPVKYRMFSAYRLLLRLIPMTPGFVTRFMKRRGVIKLFERLPVDLMLRVIDLFMLLRPSDRDARTYFKNYVYLFTRRFKKGHPAYFRKGGS